LSPKKGDLIFMSMSKGEFPLFIVHYIAKDSNVPVTSQNWFLGFDFLNLSKCWSFYFMKIQKIGEGIWFAEY